MNITPAEPEIRARGHRDRLAPPPPNPPIMASMSQRMTDRMVLERARELQLTGLAGWTAAQGLTDPERLQRLVRDGQVEIVGSPSPTSPAASHPHPLSPSPPPAPFSPSSPNKT